MPPRPSFWSQLRGYADTVSEQLQLSKLNTLKDQVNQHLNEWFPALGSVNKEVRLGQRRLRVLKKLGEGGYSTVYLVEDVPLLENQSHAKGSLGGPRYALKEVITQGQDQLLEAEREIEVMKSLNHTNLMPILDEAVITSIRGQARYKIVYMLFPLYEGNIWDYVEQRGKENNPLTPAEVLNIFLQLCHALKAMHSTQPAITHRDVKPHNLLWTEPREETTSAHRTSCLDAGLDSAHLVARSADDFSKKHANNPKPSLKAVLMDFGSAGPAVVTINSRSQALSLQEDAEKYCTAPYRAPELWDVPSSCIINEKIDVWSAGCVLYFLMVGESPFEQTASEAGGSLMLAIVNGQYSWPEEVQKRYPPALRDVVAACLELNPSVRPSIDQICSVIERLANDGN